jgi:pilus assembly protein CpaB
MSIRTALIVALALVFGLSVAAGIGSLRGQPAAAAEPETVPVVVAAEDIARFTSLSAGQLRIRQFPKDMAPAGAFTQVEEVVGRIPLTQIIRDELVLERRLAPKGSGRGMGPGIEKGKRAFTIQTPHVSSGVAGFILPGSRVDVLLTVNANEAHGGALTVTLLQNMEILAVDQRVDIPSENKVDVKELRSVTLLVTPDEAAKLDLGQSKGTLHLTLRNPDDDQFVRVRKATLADIGLQEERAPAAPGIQPPPPPEPPRPFRIRTVHGTREATITIRPSTTPPGR